MATPTGKAAAVLLALLLSSCGDASEPKKVDSNDPARNGHSEEIEFTNFQEAALMGGTLLAEGKDGCPYIRRAAELAKKQQGEPEVIAFTPEAEGIAQSFAKEILETHGARCGVK